MKSLNSFADHAPKRDWLVSFFELKEDFFTEHTLGPMMYDMFRRFLRDAGLNEKNHFTDFAELISNIGWETDTALGLILINLAMENPQIESAKLTRVVHKKEGEPPVEEVKEMLPEEETLSHILKNFSQDMYLDSSTISQDKCVNINSLLSWMGDNI